MAEAAERRIQEQESRGVKNPERVKRAQKRAEQEDQPGMGGQPALRWTQD